jgi:hypothetical protein
VAAAYEARKKPVAAAVFWGTSMVHVAVQSDDGSRNYTSVNKALGNAKGDGAVPRRKRVIARVRS